MMAAVPSRRFSCEEGTSGGRCLWSFLGNIWFSWPYSRASLFTGIGAWKVATICPIGGQCSSQRKFVFVLGMFGSMKQGVIFYLEKKMIKKGGPLVFLETFVRCPRRMIVYYYFFFGIKCYKVNKQAKESLKKTNKGRCWNLKFQAFWDHLCWEFWQNRM